MLFPKSISSTKLSAIARKKLQKEISIITSAFQLFVEKGVGRTSIDDIVKKAGLAKGTFYLYFKDKDELLDRMISKLCTEAVSSASNLLDKEQERNPKMEIGDSVVFFAEQLFKILFENLEMLPIIDKNLSKGLFNLKEDNPAIEKIISRFQIQFMQLNGTSEDADKRLYMIIEIVNSVFYNAVIDQTPYSFSEIKPLLLQIIRNLAYPDIKIRG